jgi:hypothetical protein
VSDIFIAPATCVGRNDTETGSYMQQQQDQGMRDPLHGKRFSSCTPVEHACTVSLSFSLHSCNLLPLTHKRESRGPLQKRSSGFLCFASSFSELSFAYLYPLLQISVNNTTTRTGCRVLLSGGPNKYKPLCTRFCAIVQGSARNPRNLLSAVREPCQSLSKGINNKAPHIVPSLEEYDECIII